MCTLNLKIEEEEMTLKTLMFIASLLLSLNAFASGIEEDHPYRNVMLNYKNVENVKVKFRLPVTVDSCNESTLIANLIKVPVNAQSYFVAMEERTTLMNCSNLATHTTTIESNEITFTPNSTFTPNTVSARLIFPKVNRIYQTPEPPLQEYEIVVTPTYLP